MFLIDFFSIVSLLGIWPRFIEPRLVKKTHLLWELREEDAHLEGLTILHFSDLHFQQAFSQKFLEKIVRNVSRIKPDLILFTGDFICYSRLEDPERLKKFLQRLSAPLGCFCCFGNHDYAQYVSRNKEGVYDTITPISPLKGLWKGIKTVFSSSPNKNVVSPRALSVSHHESLCKLLKETPFTLLENTTVTLPIGLNISGLGDMALGRCRPETAFSGYDARVPGIVMSHNPDTIVKLMPFPGNWVLSGHTHGEQIHFPWPRWARAFSQKLARLENSEYTRGLYTISKNKKLYVTRGLGCHKPFRLFSPPELCVIKTRVKPS